MHLYAQKNSITEESDSDDYDTKKPAPLIRKESLADQMVREAGLLQLVEEKVKRELEVAQMSLRRTTEDLRRIDNENLELKTRIHSSEKDIVSIKTDSLPKIAQTRESLVGYEVNFRKG